MSYKWCIVPACKNTSIRTPQKLFVCVPKDTEMRQKWLKLARRDPNDIRDTTMAFVCEDHFNIEKDMANYRQYTMGFSKRIIMVDGCLPSKFDYQKDRTKRICATNLSRSAFTKRQRTQLIQECEAAAAFMPTVTVKEEVTDETYMPTTVTVKEEIPDEAYMPTDPQETSDQSTHTEPIIISDKSIQCNFRQKVKFRSKAVQTKTLTNDASVSPDIHLTTPSHISQSNINPCRCHEKPSKSGVTNVNNSKSLIHEEQSVTHISLYTDPPIQDASLPTYTLSEASESGTNIAYSNKGIDKMECLRQTLHLIAKKPMMYIGISNESYFLIHLIHKHTNINHEHILLCLKKIRLNSTFSELEDNFGLPVSYASKLFLRNIPLIASVLRPFIVNMDNIPIKKTLPIPFRHKYNVTCIIDCLEINIQKQTKPLFQALTWSEYKKNNTVKYIISCNPNGLVNYISPGFGGRASDVTILQNCNFLDGLEPGNTVLADSGFKNVEQILDAKGIKFLRPPSVVLGSKLSKREIQQTKNIASLRILTERVKMRIREFHMLKQHAVIDQHFVRILDDVIIIACALINIQESLVK